MTPADTLREALEQIRDHWACQYDHPRKEAEMYRGSYGIGVTDGHRACAKIATAALASEPVAGTETHSCPCGAGEEVCPGTDGKPLCALPAPAPAGREEIARIVDPRAFEMDAEYSNKFTRKAIVRALVTADAILALGAPVAPRAQGAGTYEQVEAGAKAIARMIPTDSGHWNDGFGLNFPREYSASEIKLIREISRVCVIAALATPPAPGAADRERNLRRLVIAARAVCFDNQGPDAIRALDKASEAFSELVAWENDPNDEIAPAALKDSSEVTRADRGAGS